MKSATLITTLSLATLLAIPPLLTHGRSPDLSDVKLEQLPDPGSIADFPTVAAPANCTACHLTAPANFADVSSSAQIVPASAEAAPVVVAAVEDARPAAHLRQDPGHRLRWLTDRNLMKRTAGNHGHQITASLHLHQGSGAGGLEFC